MGDMRLVLAGQSASPGAAQGTAYRYHAAPWVLPTAEGCDPALERARLERALEAARGELRALSAETRQRLSGDEAGIFESQEMFLRDPLLEEAVRGRIAEGETAARAWWQGVQEAAQQVRAIGEEPWLSRAADLTDAGERVMCHLTGQPPPAATGDLTGKIVLAQEVMASQALALARGGAAGLALAGGSLTSHAAILARAMSWPMVVGLGEALWQIADGASLWLDGDTGRLVVRPQGEGHIARATAVPGRATTRDGHAVALWANIATLEGARRAVAVGAEGVGLLRTEFLYLGNDQLPDELAQAAAYGEIAIALSGRPLVIRTLDHSADKAIGPQARDEPNPALGLRGIRASLAQPKAFLTQVRAILRAASRPGGVAIRLMFPMVSTLEEWRAARGLVDVARGQLAALGLEVPPAPVGCMVEVPALALLGDALAAEADFLSLGTNDLAQYLLAADRDNPQVAALAAGPQPALLRLVDPLARAARAAGKPISVCGELAADPALAPLWVGLGLDVLSMDPSAIAAVREAVAGLDLREARRMARACLRCTTVGEVRAALQ